MLRVQGLGLKGSGCLGFKGFRVFRDQGLGLRFQDLGLRVHGSRLRVSGLGSKVLGLKGLWCSGAFGKDLRVTGLRSGFEARVPGAGFTRLGFEAEYGYRFIYA